MDKRLDSLDALRGFDMFFITGGSALLAALGTLITGNDHSWIAVQMTHASWTEPLRIYDFIFPLFLFIAGVTFPFSTEKRLARGDGTRAITLNVLRRALTLVVLGLLFEQVQKLDWPHFRVWSVIGRIGIAWGAAALLTLHCRFRTCVIVTAVLLLGWWIFLRLVPSPDAVGPDALAERVNCFATWFDTHYLTTAHRHEGGLATIAMLPTAFFGIWSGMWLKMQREGLSPNKKVLQMIGVGVLMMLVAWGWARMPFGMPVLKGIWSSSYALLAAGISLILLAAFHWVIDVKGYKAWSFYFRVIGMNAVTIYFVQRFVPFKQIGAFFLGALPQAFAVPGWAPFVEAFGRCLFAWLFLYILYRNKVFFKA